MSKYLLLLITFFYSLHSNENVNRLDAFFRTLIADTEAGYVMYGVKPVCIMGFSNEDRFYVENEHNRIEVDLYEGIKLLDDLKLKNKELIIHVYHNPDPLVPEYRHLLIINRSLFLDTVKKNLPLFQTLLGPNVTPSALLEELLKPGASWHAPLKGSKVLIGILLGFGTSNSICESRLEEIEDYILQGENIPFKGKYDELGISKKFIKDMVFQSDSRTVTQKLLPSFGFKSLKEEYEYLHAKLEISSELLVKEKPYFIFGRIKDDPETKDLIVKLEETQKSIQKLLASPNFLDEVLRQFEGDAKIINYIDTTHNELSELVAAHIWEAIKDEDEIYKDNFLLGMQGDRLKNIDELDFRKIQAIKRITNNLEKSALIFKNIKDHENYIVLLTDKLYYKILKTAPGETLNGSSRIKISYVIKDYENEIIAEKKHHICDLDELIPGFALGLIGMKKGEIREIVIHPCLSYGLETAFEKGVVLFIKVELHDFESNTHPYLYEEFDLSMPTIENQEPLEAKAFNDGFSLWSHYKKSPECSLEKVLDFIMKFQKGHDYKKYLDRDKLNTLHLRIYHRS